MKRFTLIVLMMMASAGVLVGCGDSTTATGAAPVAAIAASAAWPDPDDRVVLSDAEWRKRLDPQAYTILREAGTERPFNNAFHDYKAEGNYTCAGCGNRLYRSADKFDSGTGWPSFTRSAEQRLVRHVQENDGLYNRIELRCARCDGHLGHVFDDGPPPTGKRHCVNSAALKFVARDGGVGGVGKDLLW